ncbi:unnamed protein product [Psylliodes chrysocephalus]|uniref:Uncharacterized protein n=1 Tax=Psylliodes chrysocephalus TaxID=3402493 RepID=A0A9P0GI95_9CUCU|nr:unnamed protein product [Psylliodes chrysocephala]
MIGVSGRLQDSVNDTDEYQKQCYSSFTSLMSKYCNPNPIMQINFPSTSCPRFSNSPINVCYTTQDNITPIVDNSDLNTFSTDLAIDSFYKIPELEKESATERSDNLKNVCFFCEKDQKQVKGK